MKPPAFRKAPSRTIPVDHQPAQDVTPEIVMTEMINGLIRDRAYLLYMERGQQDGQALEDWYRAEREILQRLNQAAA